MLSVPNLSLKSCSNDSKVNGKVVQEIKEYNDFSWEWAVNVEEGDEVQLTVRDSEATVVQGEKIKVRREVMLTPLDVASDLHEV